MPNDRDFEIKLALVQAMAHELEDYLMGDALYRQLVVHTTVGDRLPKMSLGAFLETLETLEWAQKAGRLTAEQRQPLTEARKSLEGVRRRFPTAYRGKLSRELKSNLDSWNWFLQECRENPRRCHEEYPFEVRIRNRIATLVDALGKEIPADLASRLERLDDALRRLIVPGRFVLAEELQTRYPRDRYWWLYGQPARGR